MIRKGKVAHKGFAFSGEERSSVTRGMSIMNTTKPKQHKGPKMPEIEEEKSIDISKDESRQ